MANPVGFGPTWRIDGPSPQPPPYSLLNAARVVDDLDAQQIERWINGVKVYPFVKDVAETFDACAPSSTKVDKSAGVTAVPLPEFAAYSVFLTGQCSTAGIYGPGMSDVDVRDRFTARIRAAYEAIESAAVEREFLAGDVIPLNPHLDDGNGTFPFLNTATTVVNGFAVLENRIASTGRRGVIHCSPAVAMAASQFQVIRDVAGKLQTINGTVVVPGYGYSPDYVGGSTHPSGKPAPATVLQEWIYATGPVEVRRSDLVILPDDLSQGLDRKNNLVSFTVERYYVVDWDTVLQAAVLVDRCTTNCGTPA